MAHFLPGKKKKIFFIKDSNNLPLARDQISDKVHDEIDKAGKLANNIYSTLVDLKSHTQKNLSQNKEITVPLLHRSLTDTFSDLTKFMEDFLIGGIALLKQEFLNKQAIVNGAWFRFYETYVIKIVIK